MHGTLPATAKLNRKPKKINKVGFER